MYLDGVVIHRVEHILCALRRVVRMGSTHKMKVHLFIWNSAAAFD